MIGGRRDHSVSGLLGGHEIHQRSDGGQGRNERVVKGHTEALLDLGGDGQQPQGVDVEILSERGGAGDVLGVNAGLLADDLSDDGQASSLLCSAMMRLLCRRDGAGWDPRGAVVGRLVGVPAAVPQVRPLSQTSVSFPESVSRRHTATTLRPARSERGGWAVSGKSWGGSGLTADGQPAHDDRHVQHEPVAGVGGVPADLLAHPPQAVADRVGVDEQARAVASRLPPRDR